MRLRLLIASLCAALLTSCAGPGATNVTAVPSPTAKPAAPPPSAELRFALVGSLLGRNVWATFDSTGYSYNDYAVRSDYWPRLYQLSIPEGQFEPRAAAGLPSPVQPEGGFFVGSVPLRSDLEWTDGAPFTAEEVAFTVNTALSFQLGFDWQAAYDPAWLDHAQAVDAHTVKFFFKQAPTVAQWQYGALQGPVVQQAYWAPRVAAVRGLLPTADDRAEIDRLTRKAAELQQRVDRLTAGAVGLTGEQARQQQQQLQNQQGDLDKARNDLAKAQAALDAAMDAARQALYAQDAPKEPTLGSWMPSGTANGVTTNTVNAAHPFGTPAFEHTAFVVYADYAAALAALKAGKVNGILGAPGSLAASPVPLSADTHVLTNPTSVSHFLVINPLRPQFADPVLRQALSCAIDRPALARDLPVAPLASLIPDGSSWATPDNALPCAAGPARGKAVSMLRSAGYTWSTEPAGEQPGTGLVAPDGQAIPPVVLLAPSQSSDPQAAGAAEQVSQAAAYLGIQLAVRPASPADIRFALFNSRDYDMVIAGWRLAAYPGYLCDWFGDGNPFQYSNDQVQADCRALSTTSDLPTARQLLNSIGAALDQDPAFIPLFAGQTYDLQRGIVYPFDRILNGLSGVFGAPSLAGPATP